MSNNKESEIAFRIEHDLIGDKEIPITAYYGIQTLRAIENFSISTYKLSDFPSLVKGLATVKAAAALANTELGLLDEEMLQAILKACEEIENGELNDEFKVDMMQGGAGTSTNMNANEVIANRALEILGHKKGEYSFCHPNNHINLSQSTNDAYPTALKLALYHEIESLVNSVEILCEALRKKSEEFADIIKMGRTQLQDAVPMTLGQEFAAFYHSLKNEIKTLRGAQKQFLIINMGGTAIGTGINSDPEYALICTRHLAERTHLPFELAQDLIEATQDTSSFVNASSALKKFAIKISKICNDLRLLSSGPRVGLSEIQLPAMQAGSSIMPGKVNPVIPEVVNQIAFRVIGNDLTITMASEAGQLQLNVMEPVIAFTLLESIQLLRNGCTALENKCIKGIKASPEKLRNSVLDSIGIVTAINPYIGYEKATEIATLALETGKGVYDLILEKQYLSKEELDSILKPENMIIPRKFR